MHWHVAALVVHAHMTGCLRMHCIKQLSWLLSCATAKSPDHEVHPTAPHRRLGQARVVMEQRRQRGGVARVRKLLQAVDLLNRVQGTPPVQLRILSKEHMTGAATA